MNRMCDLIRDNREALLGEWMRDVKRLAAFHSAAELRDHIPGFLDTLADQLDHAAAAQDVTRAAVGHAVERLREGFDLRQVVAEYRILRRCLVRLAFGREADPASFERMHELLDDAVAEASAQYTAARQRSLRDSEERFFSIVEHAPALICMKDVEGRYTLINRRYEEVFGIDRQQWLGKTAAQILPAAFAEVIQANDRTVLATDTALEAEESGTIGGESRTWITSKFPVHNADGAIAGLCGIAMDITERKRVEAMREQFVGVLGHDLRNPLQTIVLALALAKDAVKADEPLRHAVENGERQAQQMGRMIGDLLDFTRARLGGGIPIRRVPLNMGEVCQDVVQSLTQKYTTRAIAVQVLGDLRGEWDRDRVVQVIDNLVSNALKHGQGSVQVLARADGADHVVVEVSNHGAAIPPQLLPVIFEPFRRPKNIRVEGLGLGLYIVRMIVVAHGGTIEARSSEESGTLFRIRWPRLGRQAA